MSMNDRMLGECADHEIADYLELIGSPEEAEAFRAAAAGGQGLFRPQRPYAYTASRIGFIEALTTAETRSPILSLGEIAADQSLRGQQVKVTLDAFYAENYPGLGRHRVLCEFSGKNQAHDEVEELKFASEIKVNDGESAALSGKPIFMGLRVGDNGIAFTGRTINLKSEDHDVIVEALDSSAFKAGLTLLASAQPALKPFVSLATGCIKSILSQSDNKVVFDFTLGLDFAGSPTSARLRHGTYIVVQAPTQAWNWKSFVWDHSAERIVKRVGGEPLNLNYLALGVSKYDSAPPLSAGTLGAGATAAAS
ncbi:MAG: hypothetical protein DI534_11000 [Leifsonia xyli]|jgi:hypothetical protein|nr:MAG: hypothetical protein DI534_11000 [Leifsonia xyli]